jgi:hypothetical protein
MTHRLAFLLVAPIACGLFAVGCGSSGSGSPPASSSGSAKASLVAYARCMRAHGISDFPDPDANGNLKLQGHGGSDLDPNNPRFKAADTACKSLLPPPQAAPKDLKAQNLKYARCMRAHGIADFPDPQPDGKLKIQLSPGSDLDPNNARYKAADEACKKYQPGGPGGSRSTGGAS